MELMRFRVARAPQRRTPDPKTILTLDSPFDWTATKIKGVPPAGAPAPKAVVAPPPSDPLGSRVALDAYLATVSPLFSALAALDAYLTAKSNSPDVAELADTITTNIVPLVGDWGLLRNELERLLVLGMERQGEAGVLDRVVRLLLIMGLVELWAQQPDELPTPIAVYNALRWRTVVLSDAVAQNFRNRVNRRRMGEFWQRLEAPGGLFALRSGFADFFVTEEEWLDYEAGEVAFIENILPGEVKERRHFDLSQLTQTTTIDTTKTTSQQNETQSTDRSDLRTQSTSDVSLAAHVDGKVDTSGKYGLTTVNTHLGGSLDFSSNHSTEQAATQSHETVARAVTSVTETVRTIRTTSTLNRTTDLERHALDNAGKPDAIVGIYRWVNKRSAVRVVRYPHRFLLEFVVPEPGAWLRWLHRLDQAAGITSVEPMPFTDTGKADGKPLAPGDLLYLDCDKDKPSHYLQVGARYAAAGLVDPPGPQRVAVNLEKAGRDDHGSVGTQPIHYAAASLNVPDGWEADTWMAFVLSWTDPGNGGSYITISVGGSRGTATPDDPNATDHNSSYRKLVQIGPGGDDIQGSIGAVTQGTVPIAVLGNGIDGYSINVVVTCLPTDAATTQWKINTFEVIAGAYYALKRQHDQDVANAQLAGASKTFGDSSSPAWNQQVVTEDLKRQVVEFLLGSPFGGRNAIQKSLPLPDPITGVAVETGPEIDVAAAATHAAEIEFLEQAFEWENLVYVLYPYYWADRARWAEMAGLEGVDPDFTRFLRAGAARVVVPARPMFAAQVNLYAAFGVLWGGGQPPAPGDPDYLSVADEIKAQEQQKPGDGTPVDSWEITVPTTLLWLQISGTPPVLDGTLPTNEKLDFPPPITVVATKLVFTVQITRTTANTVITPPIQVTAFDDFGNAVTSWAGSVTVAKTSGTGTSGASLRGTTTVTALKGTATFSDLSLTKKGTGYTLTATSRTDLTLLPGVSAVFDIK